ncbi:MAG: cation transporter [Rhodocyclaceae bacterium]|nr:cation transporter [Rhodocyclaceae bacterium]
MTGIATNISLVVAQIVVGVMAHAFSLVADAMHTLADLMSDGLVLVANKQGGEPADRNHPYGHGRIETAVSMALGAMLVAVGVGFLVAAAGRIERLGELPPVEPAALLMAVLTLAAKEGLFRYLRRVARQVRSPMVEANAWHARSDAASSLVVAVGIGGSLAGHPFLEPLAAMLVGLLIARMGIRLAMAAVRELIDTGLGAEETEAMRHILLESPGVMGVHDLRTRRMGPQVLVDAHVQVDPRITVSEGHRIAETARVTLLRAREDVQDVLVHVDVEDDLLPPSGPRIPRREALVSAIREAMGADMPAPSRVQLHYLRGGVEIELFLPKDWLAGEPQTDPMPERLARAAAVDGSIHVIRVVADAQEWCANGKNAPS